MTSSVHGRVESHSPSDRFSDCGTVPSPGQPLACGEGGKHSPLKNKYMLFLVLFLKTTKGERQTRILPSQCSSVHYHSNFLACRSGRPRWIPVTGVESQWAFCLNKGCNLLLTTGAYSKLEETANNHAFGVESKHQHNSCKVRSETYFALAVKCRRLANTSQILNVFSH